MNDCSRPRCSTLRYALGLCEFHYGRYRRLQRVSGATDRIPTAPIRKHLRLLRRRGWTWQQIAAAGGTSTTTLHQILRGQKPRMRRDKVGRIVAIPPVWQSTRLAVPMLGTRRRLDALAWQGWSNRRVADQLRLSRFTFSNTYRSHVITAVVAAQVAEFYDRHAHLPGPDPVYAKRARTLGALPAWCWDDDTIDDPGVRAQGVRRVAS